MNFVISKSLNVNKLVNPLSASSTKWSDTLKQFVGCCQRVVILSQSILSMCGPNKILKD